MRCDGVEALDSELAWRNDFVFVQADFEVQVRVPDSCAARVCERVPFAESDVRLDGDIVAFGCVLLLAHYFFDGLGEAALVGEYPGLSAVALEVHHFAVAEGRGLDFLDVPVFRGEDGPAFFHLSGIVDAGVVAGAAVLAE